MKTDILSKLRDGKNVPFREQLELIARLSVPSILAQLSSIIMSYIDASMVGHVGTRESAAIGLVASSTWLVMGIAYAAATGFTVQVAQLLGAKRDCEARNLLKISLVSVTLFSIFLTLVCVSVSFPLPRLLGGGEEIYRDSWVYFFVFALSIPVITLTDLASEMIQCSGEMKVPSVLQILMAVLNILLNYLLIFSLEMGVLGAALSTLLSRLSVGIFLVFYMLKILPALKIRRGEKIEFDFRYIRRSLKIGLPVAFEQTIMSGGQIAYIKIVAPLGDVPLAANSLAITAESLCYMPAYGLGSAAATICAQSYGAKRKDMAYRLGWLTTFSGIFLMLFVSALMFAFAPQMIGLLSPDGKIRRLGARILRIEAFCEPLYGASLVAGGALRGTGDTLVPSIFKFISMWLIRIPLALLLAGNFALEGIWFAMSFELCIRGIMFLVRLKGKRWLK